MTARAASTWDALVLDQWAGSDEPAVVTADLIWTGEELLRRAGGAADWLAACGFAEGTGVPALLDTTPASVALAVGGAFARRPLAPLGVKLVPGELATAVKAFGGAGLVTSPDHLEVAEEVARLAGVPVHVLDGDPPASAVPAARCRSDDVAVIVHTSGTTGAPKPVLARHQQLVARATVYGDVLDIGAGDRYSSASPFHHTAAVFMLFSVLARGASFIPWPWFSVEGWRLVGRLGVTHCLLVPTMIDRLLAEGALAEARPRVLQYGAAPIDPRTLREALDALPDVAFLQIFGQTECSPITHLSHADHALALADRPELLSTVGRAVPGLELRIETPDDDGIGEVTIRAPHAFLTDDDGWRRTGDLGWLSSDGYLTLHGRTGDRIVWAGENIYPIEVEKALASHPGVREVAVVGVPDRRYGETVRAIVVPADPAAPPSAAELQGHARERIAAFKVPTTFELVDELPRNASGKVVRRALVAPRS